MRERFFDAEDRELFVGARVEANGATGTVTGFDSWDVRDGPGGDGPTLIGVAPRVFVEYDDGTDEAFTTVDRTQRWMDHDDERVCEDVVQTWPAD